MRGSFFIDTNIIVYSFDAGQRQKREKARELIIDALLNGHGVISYQVIQEFMNVATRKFPVPLRKEEALMYLESVLSPLCSIFASQELFTLALSIQERTGYSYYNSLIVAAALSAGCHILYSEDMQDGREIEGLKIVNPFVAL